MTVKLWGKGVYEKNESGSSNTQYFVRHSNQFIYSKLDFLNSAFGVVPEELEGLETTADVPAFDCHRLEPYFMYYTAIQPQFYLKNGTIADGSRKAKRIHADVFLEMPLYVPCIEEQRLIIDALSQIDTLITLHQRKITFTRHISIYVWEQRKLAELAEINPKCTLPDSFEYVDLESVVGTEILSHRTESKETAPSRAQRLAQEGDVFYQTVRPYQKNNCIFEKPENNWVFSTGYAQMRPVNDGYFLLSLLQNEAFVKVVLDRCTGTSYPTINANDLAEIDVSFPYSSEEQKKIGDYFRKIDTLITLHQCKLKNSVFIEQNDWEQRKLNEIAQKVTEKNRDNLYDEPFTNSAEQG